MEKYPLKIASGEDVEKGFEQPSNADRPVVLGHYSLRIEHFDFIPYASLKFLRPVRIKIERWKGIEAALGLQLDDSHREWIDGACWCFLFACIYKKELPSRDRYLSDLERRAAEIAGAVDALTDMISFPTEIIDGKPEIPGRVFTSAEDHCQIIGSTEWKDSIVSLANLRDRVEKLKVQIAECDRKKAGRDSHYELDNLLQTLLYVARSAGNNLNVTSRDFRSKDGDHDNKRTPLVLFVCEIMRVLREDGCELIKVYDISERDKADAEILLNRFLDKTPGNLIEPLMAARVRIEGKHRQEKGQNSTSN